MINSFGPFENYIRQILVPYFTGHNLTDITSVKDEGKIIVNFRVDGNRYKLIFSNDGDIKTDLHDAIDRFLSVEFPDEVVGLTLRKFGINQMQLYELYLYLKKLYDTTERKYANVSNRRNNSGIVVFDLTIKNSGTESDTVEQDGKGVTPPVIGDVEVLNTLETDTGIPDATEKRGRGRPNK